MEDGDGEGNRPNLSANQVRVLQARDSDILGRTQYPWRIPVAFVGILAFIALILGSASIDRLNNQDDDDDTYVAVTCPYGDILYGDSVHEFDGHYFQIVGSSSGSVNWPEAVRDANSRCFSGNQGYLANIGSAEENAFLYAIWKNHSSFSSTTTVSAWIGAADMNEEKTFEWIGPGKMSVGVPFYSDGAPVDDAYNNFASGEPSEEGMEDCVEMRSGQGMWNDRECYAAQNFFFVEFGEPSTA